MRTLFSQSAALLLSCSLFPLLGNEPHQAPPTKAPSNISSIGKFGVQLWLIEDQTFYESWEKQAEGVRIPAIDIAKRGVPFNPIIVFAGCKEGNDGLANVTYDILITKPDGSIFTNQKGLNCWVQLPAPKGNQLQLCAQQLGIVFGPTDQSGKYTVQAVVYDQLAGSKLNTTQSISLK